MEQAEAIKELDVLAGHKAFIQIYGTQKKYDLMEEEIHKAMMLAPEDLGLKFSLGEVYVITEHFEKAFSVYEKMVIEDPDNINGHYQYGRVASISGDNLDLGIQRFHFFIEQNPDHAWAHYRLGLIYEHKEEFAQAAKEYQKALKMDSKHKEAKEALKQLNKKVSQSK